MGFKKSNKKNYFQFLKNCRDNFFSYIHKNIGCSFEVGSTIKPLDLFEQDKKRHLRLSSPQIEDYDFGFRLRLKILPKQLLIYYGCKTEKDILEFQSDLELHAKNFFHKTGFAKSVDLICIDIEDVKYQIVQLYDLMVTFDRDKILEEFEIKR